MTNLQAMLAQTAIEQMAKTAGVTEAEVINAINSGAENVVKRFQEYVKLGVAAVLDAAEKGKVHENWMEV